MQLIRAYIDESGDEHLFTLSCAASNDFTWFHFTNEWEALIAQLNKHLRAQGRTQITRFHAADCSNRQGEFRGWSKDELQSFATTVLNATAKYRIDIAGFTLALTDLLSVFPHARQNPRGFAYVFLLRFLMSELCRETLHREKTGVVSLIHDRSDYDAALQESFTNMVADERFHCRERFAALTSASWEEYVPLQLADLIAYENFKEYQRQLAPRPRRRSLEHLVTHSQLGGYARHFDRAKLEEARDVLDRLDQRTKAMLLRESRVQECITARKPEK